MSSIVNGYMDAIERENDMFNRSIEIESNKISLMVEAYYNKLENDYLLAEQKVMMENGTYDDLTYLYMEANEESDKNKKGIFAAIKRFIQKIIDRIKSLFGGKESYEGKAPAYYKDLSEDGNKIIGWFNNVLNKIKSSAWGEIALIVAKPVAASIVGETIKNIGKKASNKLINYTTQEYNKIKEFFKNLFKKTTDTSEAITEVCEKSNNENATKLGGVVKTALTQVTTFFTDLWNKFKAHFNRNDDNNENSEQPSEQGQNSEQSAEQGQNSEQSADSSEQPNTKESDITDDLKSQGNDLGKEMLALASAMNGTANMLKNKKIVSDDDLKDVYDAYNRAKKEKKIQTCYSCVTSMFTVLKNKTPKSQKQKIDEYERKLTIITNKYNKFSKELKEYTFESYYYLMYDYEIITESDECDFSITGDPLVDELLDILDEF